MRVLHALLIGFLIVGSLSSTIRSVIDVADGGPGGAGWGLVAWFGWAMTYDLIRNTKEVQ